MCKHLLKLGQSLVLSRQRTKNVIGIWGAHLDNNIRAWGLRSPKFTVHKPAKFSYLSSQRCPDMHTSRSLSVARMSGEELPVAKVTLLQGEEDRYEGILVDANGLPDDPQEFSERLDFSLAVSTVTTRLKRE